jgi:hypothetical protein
MNASDVGQPNTQSEPVAKKPRSRRLLIFVLGLVAGVASAVAWPRLGPIATCVQDIVQNEVPVPTESASDADWVKIYGEMKPVGKYDRLFSPTYNQLLDFYFKYRRPASPYPNGPQDAKDAYPAQL